MMGDGRRVLRGRRQGKLPPCFGCDNPLQTPLVVTKRRHSMDSFFQPYQAVKVQVTEEFFASLTLLSKSEWWPWLVLGSTLGLCSRPWYTEPCPNRERPPPGCQITPISDQDTLVVIPCFPKRWGVYPYRWRSLTGLVQAHLGAHRRRPLMRTVPTTHD